MLVAVVEGSRGNLEARLVRNAENKEDVEGVSAAVECPSLLACEAPFSILLSLFRHKASQPSSTHTSVILWEGRYSLVCCMDTNQYCRYYTFMYMCIVYGQCCIMHAS